MTRRDSLFLLVAASSICTASAQDYLYELGVGGGMSVAYGDVNKSKPWYDPAGAGDVVFRYNHNLRWAFVADVASYGLKGDSRDFDNHYPDGATYDFDCRFWHLGLRPEFNFWNYGWGNDFREKKRLVPFVTLGVGVGFSSGGDDSAFAFTIPIGAGMKWKVARRWNVQLTCLFTKTFSDEIDGVDDPMGIESDAIKNTDWLGSVTLGITYDFGTRCATCLNGRQ